MDLIQQSIFSFPDIWRISERDNVTDMFLLKRTVQEYSEGNIWDLKIHGGTNDLLPNIGACFISTNGPRKHGDFWHLCNL